MSFADRVRKAAGEIAKKVGRGAEAAGQSEAASLAYQRLASFQPEIGGVLQCPECWIHWGSQAPLVGIPAINPATTPGSGARAATSAYHRRLATEGRSVARIADAMIRMSSSSIRNRPNRSW